MVSYLLNLTHLEKNRKNKKNKRKLQAFDESSFSGLNDGSLFNNMPTWHAGV